MTTPTGGITPKIPGSHPNIPAEKKDSKKGQSKDKENKSQVVHEAHKSISELKEKFRKKNPHELENAPKIPVVKEQTSSIAHGIVKEKKIAQQQLRTVPGLGSQPKDQTPDMSDRIRMHRTPPFIVDERADEIKKYMDIKVAPPGAKPGDKEDYPLHNLTDIRDYKFKKWLAEQPDDTKNDLRLLSKMKEKFNEEAYESNFKGNVNGHLYDPEVIAAEMRNVLKFNDEPPFEIKNADDAKRAIAKELSSFHVEGTNIRILSDKNIDHLCDELLEVMNLYSSVYPTRSVLDTYVLCRDMARAAAYQTYFDKRSFTGSDHGVLHIFHNCKHGHNMFTKMNEHGDSDKKIALLGIVSHFYHDIGYSVGSAKASFEVMKDHPFIGAAFIHANKDYFASMLCDKTVGEGEKPPSLFGGSITGNKKPAVRSGVKATQPGEIEAEIIERAILNHAIVSFDSDTTDMYKMVRFTTSNSDACALTADQKTQTFWRDHPETLLELAKLRMFITIYPECAEKLGNQKIIKTPEIAMASWFNDPNLPKDQIFDESNFKDPVYFNAYTIFKEVKGNLLEIADQELLPPEEKVAFKEAIMNNFNAVGADVVLKQFGAELHDVSVTLNDKRGADEPKWLPAITIGPSTLFAYLESCYGREIAGGSIKKVLGDEFAVKEDDLNEAVDHVGEHKTPKEVESKVAKVHVHPPKIGREELKHLEEVIVTLENIITTTIPIQIRQKLNDYINLITPRENKAEAGQTPKDAKGKELVKIGNNYYLKNWEDYKSKFKSVSSSFTKIVLNVDIDKRGLFLEKLRNINEKLKSNNPELVTEQMRLELRTILTTDADWDVMQLSR